MNDQRLSKIEAAREAMRHVEDGMRLGIGTGSTAEEFIRLLAAAVADGLGIVGVPTSQRTETFCRSLGVPLTTLDEVKELDLAIDGADEIDPRLNLIKGGGGALLNEKIVAAAARRFIVIADHTKCVEMLGRFPLPIEVARFGLGATRRAVERVVERLALSGEIVQRMGKDGPFVTDGGHLILDASFGRIPDPHALSDALKTVPGVMEHGLFLNMADLAVVAGPEGVATIRTAAKDKEF